MMLWVTFCITTMSDGLALLLTAASQYFIICKLILNLVWLAPAYMCILLADIPVNVM